MKIYAMAICLLGTATHGATLTVEKNNLVLSGRLQNSENEALKNKLMEFPRIDTIVFKNCLGGQLGAANFTARMIKTLKLHTRFEGQCHSACAFAFLAGTSHLPVDKVGIHMVSLHSPRNPDGTQDTSETTQIFEGNLDSFTEGKLTPAVRGLIQKSYNEAAGVFFVVRNYKFFIRQETYYCDGSEGHDVSSCLKLAGVIPSDLGIFKSVQAAKN